MTRLLLIAACLLTAASLRADETVPQWPQGPYVAFCGTLGGDSKPNNPNVAYDIRDGWRAYVEQHIAPVIAAPNGPSTLLVHCVGPAYCRYRADGTPMIVGGSPYREFDFSWPVINRLRSAGGWYWPSHDWYLRDFQKVWREVAAGKHSGGRPVRIWAYTGHLLGERYKTPRPDELQQVAEWFADAGFEAMFVDASASLPNDWRLQSLQEISDQGTIKVGLEAVPQTAADEAAPTLPWYANAPAARQRDRALGGAAGGSTELPRGGVVGYLDPFGERLTPEIARELFDAGRVPCVLWREWAAYGLPSQRPLDLWGAAE